MSTPSTAPLAATTAEERRLFLVKRIVLSLACVVGLTLVVAVAFGVYHFVTDRPAKELFFPAEH